MTVRFPGSIHRAVVVIDRGWIFAGDISEHGSDDIAIDNATWVFRWHNIGFAAMVANPMSSDVELRPMPQRVIVPKGAVIFQVVVPDDWGRRHD